MKIKLQTNALVRLVLLAVMLVQGVQMTSASAEIFKCTTKAGKVFYNDKPCPSLDDEKKMRSEKDVVNGYVPPAPTKDKKLIKNGHSQSSVTQLNAVNRTKSKKKSKAENSPKSRRLTGGSGGGSGKVAEPAGIEPRESVKIPSKGNYADREKTIEDKRIYLGIRKQVE